MDVAYESLEKGAKFKCMGTTLRDQKHSIRKLRTDHAVENLLSSYLLSKNVRINVHKATILTVVLYGFETWPLLLRRF
jgi:hypothetical protein